MFDYIFSPIMGEMNGSLLYSVFISSSMVNSMDNV